MKYAAFTLVMSAFIFTSCETDDKMPEVSDLSAENVINMNSLQGRTLVTDQALLDGINSLNIDVGIVSKGDLTVTLILIENGRLTEPQIREHRL